MGFAFRGCRLGGVLFEVRQWNGSTDPEAGEAGLARFKWGKTTTSRARRLRPSRLQPPWRRRRFARMRCDPGAARSGQHGFGEDPSFGNGGLGKAPILPEPPQGFLFLKLLPLPSKHGIGCAIRFDSFIAIVFRRCCVQVSNHPIPCCVSITRIGALCRFLPASSRESLFRTHRDHLEEQASSSSTTWIGDESYCGRPT